MPYYTWQGVDLNAKIRSGTSFARSYQELNSVLFMRGVALISGKETSAVWYRNTFSPASVIAVFTQLASLLQAGIKLPNALRTVVKQLPKGNAQEIMYAVFADVHEGLSLSQSLQRYAWVFSPIVVKMVYVAEQTGNLGVGLAALSDFLRSTQAFRRTCNSALLLPMVTFVFFMAIAAVLLIFVVPHFQDVFTSLGHQIPASTRFLVAVSVWLRSYNVVILAVVLLVAWFARKSIKRILPAQYPDVAILYVPFVAPLIRDSTVMHTFRALAFLQLSGMSLIAALQVVLCLIDNTRLQQSMAAVVQAVTSGYSFRDALEYYGGYFAQEDILALISTGEESGELSDALRAVAAIYEEKVQRSLHMITILIQPLLIIVLGALITGMIVAIYLPLFSIAQGV